MPEEGAFDFIVVGAGSAGCVLANRLTEGDARVLLLEAGKWDRDPLIHVPLGIGKIFAERLHDWGYFMEPDAGLDGRGIECARGKVVGGSSSINVMAYVRGHRGDYDRWAAGGLAGWSYDDVLPYFRKAEAWEGGADAHRGGGGPLRTQRSRWRDPLLQAFVAAGREAGFPVTADYNGAVQEGFDLIQSTIHRGRRQSAATAYLRPALRRSNLCVETEALVTGLSVRDGRVAGVTWRRGGADHVAEAGREVILSAGTIDTPKLLMLSGIGDPAELSAHGIVSRVVSPAVGHNFQDHLSVLATYRRRDTSAFERGMRFDRLALSMVRALLGAEGFAGDVPIGVTAFLKTDAAQVLPDVQFLFLAAPFPARPYLHPFRGPVSDGFGCRVALLRPESRGRITLASADPAAAPRIVPNFLATEGDRETLRRGLRLVRRVVGSPAMTPHAGTETAPGRGAESDADLDAFVRRTAVTVHHPASTCRMGVTTDPNAVVDAHLRVRGIDGLRVVDASVMPDLVGGNINAAVMMLAERAADLILGRPLLAAAERPALEPFREKTHVLA